MPSHGEPHSSWPPAQREIWRRKFPASHPAFRYSTRSGIEFQPAPGIRIAAIRWRRPARGHPKSKAVRPTQFAGLDRSFHPRASSSHSVSAVQPSARGVSCCAATTSRASERSATAPIHRESREPDAPVPLHEPLPREQQIHAIARRNCAAFLRPACVRKSPGSSQY